MSAKSDSEAQGCHLKYATGWTIVNETGISSMEMSCYDKLLDAAQEKTGMLSTGNLVTVNDEIKEHDVTLLLNAAKPNLDDMSAPDNWLWSGLTRVRNNDGGEHPYDVADWEWTSGSNLTSAYEKWIDGAPEYHQNQVAINHDGDWNDTYVEKEHPYACDYKGKYVVSPARMTWPDAKVACENAGLTLAMVKDQEDADELVYLMGLILGSRYNEQYHYHNWVWTGGNDITDEGVYVWPDGTEVEDFAAIAWEDPQPDNAKYIKGYEQDVLQFSKGSSRVNGKKFVTSSHASVHAPLKSLIVGALRSVAAKSRAPPFLHIVTAPSFQLQSKNDPQ
eukprot:sb/3466581/